MSQALKDDSSKPTTDPELDDLLDSKWNTLKIHMIFYIYI